MSIRNCRRFGASSCGAFLLVGVLASCGGGADPSVPSSGLKIFVTARVHNGNFRDDVVLVGANAIEKADDFCHTDPAKPSSGRYKALLVDGVSRDAISKTDWVLRANTPYFQPFDNVRIGVTTSAAVFPTASNRLDNPIHESFGTSTNVNAPAPTSSVWTGLSEASTFAASPNNCQRWSSSLDPDYSTIGVSYATDASAFYTNGGHTCTLAHRLYCVEQ